MWACMCAFVALGVDDRTDVFSVALFCGGYAAYHALAFAVRPIDVHVMYVMPALERAACVRRRLVLLLGTTCTCNCCRGCYYCGNGGLRIPTTTVGGLSSRHRLVRRYINRARA